MILTQLQSALNKRRIALREKGPETNYKRRVGFVVNEAVKRRRVEDV